MDLLPQLTRQLMDFMLSCSHQKHIYYRKTQQLIKIYCNKNQFQALPSCGPYHKPHVSRGLSKHYHLRFDPKLGMGVCEIRRIPCACVACTPMLDKSWIYGIPSDK